MGQAVLDLLSMSQNQAWLGGIPGLSPGYGIGNYVSQGYGGAGTAVLGGTPGTNNTNVASITVSSIGSGYTTAPTVVIAGPCTLQATATATVSRRHDHRDYIERSQLWWRRLPDHSSGDRLEPAQPHGQRLRRAPGDQSLHLGVRG